MSKTLLDLDDAALNAAKTILGTKTKVETVNAALREVAAVVKRRSLFAHLAEGDLDNPDVMVHAWR